MPIFTDDANLWNLNKDIAFYKKSENMKKMWYKLHKIIKSGYACYIGDSTYTDLAEYRLDGIEAKHRETVNLLVTERDNLKTALDKTRWSLERGKDLIMLDIKKIKDAKQTLQGRIDLIYKSDKLLEEPYRRIAENFQNASYLTKF